MIKISTKGWYKICEEATRYSDDIDDDVLDWDYAEQEYKLRLMEFEPSDFQGAVVLTTNEAKQIIDSLHRAIKAYVELSKLTNGWTEVSNEENSINMLKERIGQVESME